MSGSKIMPEKVSIMVQKMSNGGFLVLSGSDRRMSEGEAAFTTLPELMPWLEKRLSEMVAVSVQGSYGYSTE